MPLLPARRWAPCLLVLALAACGDSTPTAGSSLSDVVLSSVGSGFAIPPSGPNGALTTDQAANATPASPSAVRDHLSSPDFAGAYERAWRRGDEFVTILVFGFVTGTTASSFAAFELQAIAASGTAEVYSAGRALGEKAFLFSGSTRASSATTQFCQGVWFAAQTDAVEVTHCSPTRPDYPNQVIDLGNQELDLIVGFSAPSP